MQALGHMRAPVLMSTHTHPAPRSLSPPASVYGAGLRLLPVRAGGHRAGDRHAAQGGHGGAPHCDHGAHSHCLPDQPEAHVRHVAGALRHLQPHPAHGQGAALQRRQAAGPAEVAHVQPLRPHLPCVPRAGGARVHPVALLHHRARRAARQLLLHLLGPHGVCVRAAAAVVRQDRGDRDQGRQGGGQG
ncbi:hypothetical protein TSOC_007950 [Tetrabaena socialis]|uniref:Uncharacterized protein n=1 Tax=Tetrabaena socialis TaxID=47790 RepID=A0A2J7ZZU8_9CHLO|nr:hypothetical protein TSOC_007950 [Tetrabaena socialis]|eukprot:PNH05785.1 hypothetical protein TSOC_007950 [Tetrabaena socialis]